MAQLVQYCEYCYLQWEVSCKPGTRGTCKGCGETLKAWTDLKPTIKFITAWNIHGIDNLAPCWAERLGEQRFDTSRRRIDFSWPDFKLGLEIDGYGPGHLNMGQINKDHEKVNDAAVLGWIVLRYTSQMIGSKAGAENAVNQAAEILQRKMSCSLSGS